MDWKQPEWILSNDEWCWWSYFMQILPPSLVICVCMWYKIIWPLLCCLYTVHCTATFLHWGYCAWNDFGVVWHFLSVCWSSDDYSEHLPVWYVTVYPFTDIINAPSSLQNKRALWCDEEQASQDHLADVLESLTKNKHQRIVICPGESHKWNL